MPELGKKYTCYSCHTKFYDLGKPVPLCPKCGSDQRNAEEAPLITSSRSRRVVEDPIEDDNEFGAEPEAATPDAEEDDDLAAAPEREEDLDEEEDEDY